MVAELAAEVEGDLRVCSSSSLSSILTSILLAFLRSIFLCYAAANNQPSMRKFILWLWQLTGVVTAKLEITPNNCQLGASMNIFKAFWGNFNNVRR